MSDKRVYFAAETSKELAGSLLGKMGEWSSHLGRTGLQKKWVKSYNNYFGKHYSFTGESFGDASIRRGGKDGEIALVTVNHYRNLIKHIHNLATNQRPSFDVRAINSDLRSLQQAKLANNILEAYLREKRLGRYLKQAAEHALVFGKGFVKVTWEPSLGRPYTAEERTDSNGNVTNRVIYEGDVDITCPDVFSVLCDQSLEDWQRAEWVTVRTSKNKFSLATRYPEQSENILNTPSKSESQSISQYSFQQLDETADIFVYEFYHKRTDALPNGRYVLFVNEDTVLYDGPMPYSKLPVFRITPGEIFGSTEGYTDAFDLLPIQEAINTLTSAAFTNQNAFGIQNVLVPEGCNLSVDQITESLAILKYNPQAGKPEALQLTSTPAELFTLLGDFVKVLETLSGVNSVARGNPDSSLKSGVALGLVQSMAVQFASGFQQSWAEILEDSGTFILDLLRTFAHTERMIAMAGKVNAGSMVSFKGSDLENVERVVVELGNPMARTTAGRVQIADNLLEKGMIKTSQEYLTVLNTGTLDPATEGVESELSLIRQENEMMLDGKSPEAIVGDAHVLHIQEHRTVVNNPTLRLLAAQGDQYAKHIVSNALKHISDHMALYQSQDPLWSMVSGEPPAVQPMMPPPPQPQGSSGSASPTAELMGPPGVPVDQPQPLGEIPLPKTANIQQG